MFMKKKINILLEEKNKSLLKVSAEILDVDVEIATGNITRTNIE